MLYQPTGRYGAQKTGGLGWGGEVGEPGIKGMGYEDDSWVERGRGTG